MLETFKITLEEVRPHVVRNLGEGDTLTPGRMPFNAQAKKVLELALREALSLGHNYIGTEHILLGLVREGDSVAAGILLDLDADAEKIRNEIIRLLSGPGRREQARTTEEEGEAMAANPELGKELERLREEKEAALDAGEFERAARLRDHERRLRQKLFGWPVAWQSGSHEVVMKTPRVPLPFLSGLPLGWLPFGLALGLGIAIGWFIWG